MSLITTLQSAKALVIQTSSRYYSRPSSILISIQSACQRRSRAVDYLFQPSSAGRLYATNNNSEDRSITSNDDTIKHRKQYSIKGIGKQSIVKMQTITGHTIQTDVPQKMGGKDSAPQPVEHLLAALIGCTQATSIYVGRMMKPRLLIDRIEFDIHGYRDERGALALPIDNLPSIPARLQCVSGTVKVYFKKNGMNVSDEELSILAEQTEQRCPVANMMHASGCDMDIKWVNGSSSSSSSSSVDE